MQWKRCTIRKRNDNNYPVLVNMDQVLYVTENVSGATIVFGDKSTLTVNEDYDHFDPRPNQPGGAS